MASAFLFCAPFAARAATAPVILSINYSCPDPVIHIGSRITVYMSAVIPTATLSNVSVLASTPGDITLGSNDLFGQSSGTVVIITDGTRTWRFTTTFNNQTSFAINNTSHLLRNAAPFTVADYTTLANNSFRMYLGTLVTGATAGSPALNVDIGSFDNVVLRDNATLGDNLLNDGEWTGLYDVPDLGFSVSNGKFFGMGVVNGVIASNSPMQSTVGFNLDGLRPNIETVLFKTTKPNYNGVMYLSSASQLSPWPSNPTNAQGRFDITVNKKSTQVDIVINSTPVAKQLSPLIIPANAINPNGWKIWNGDDGSASPRYVPDATYTASLYIKDEHGVTGLTRTVQIKVVSVKPEIKNVVLNPPSLNTFPVINDSVLTVISHRMQLSNDSGSTLRPSLNVLGWEHPVTKVPVGTFNQPDYTVSMVYSVNERSFLKPDGSIGIPIDDEHDFGGDDRDESQILFHRSDPLFLLPACYGGLPASDPFSTTITSNVVDIGDGDGSNDWDPEVFNPLNVAAGSASDPTLMQGDYGLVIHGDTPPQGSYRLVVRSILSGLDAAFTGPADDADLADLCNPSPALVWRTRRWHFYPSARPENGDPTSFRGLGVFAEDISLIFPVNSNQPSTTDTTPPIFLTSNPQDGSLITDVFGANAFGPAKPLTAQVQDVETPINFASHLTFIRVKTPSGGYVGGSTSHNGGGSNNSATIIFTPNAVMNVGGDYTMEVFACNQSGLCIQKDVTFTIQDQTPPSVSGVELVSQASASNVGLTMFQTAPDGPYSNILEVWAAISVPSTTQNTINWDLCTITLLRISGTTSINIPLVRQTAVGTVPSDGKLKYKLVSPIKDAGLFEVIVQTFSEDDSGTVFSGPLAGFVNPRFTTLVNSNTLSVLYPFGSPSPREAISGTQPITVSAGGPGFQPLTSNTQATIPVFSSLAANPGYSPITSSAGGGWALRFNFNSVLASGPVTWQYQAGNPLRFTLYYDDADLPAGILHSDLRLFGYAAPSWTQVPAGSFVHTFSNVSANTFVIDAPNGSTPPVGYAVYAIFYPAIVPNQTPTASPTAVPFMHTRSFNPNHSNPLYRKAKIYYADVTPKDVELKVYDSSGVLVRSMGVGSGISLSDVQMDAFYGKTSYYFSWDGLNDTGSPVKNGIYLLRYKVTRLDNSTDMQTRIVALIK